MSREITIVYAHEVGSTAEIFDGLKVARLIESGLQSLGYQTTLHDIQPDASLMPNLPAGSIVFNLVERINGSDALAAGAIAHLEQMGLILTGARAAHFLATANKVAAKKTMQAYGVPVLPSYTEADLKANPDIRGPLIVKSTTEHASMGLDEKSVVKTSQEALERIKLCKKKWGGVWFAEPYVDGREFNVSLLQRGHDVDVLPIVELKFNDYPADKPKIIDFGTKWDETTFGYNHAIATFEKDPKDAELFARLEQVAKDTWRSFGLCGYVRIDMRVDLEGNPWVLEVNVDPSLGREDYLAWAAERMGMSYEQVLARIVDEAVQNEKLNNMVWRNTPAAADVKRVRALTKATGFFNDEEIRVAGEMVEEALRGEENYCFLFAENKGQLAGYACFGDICLTDKRYDLYWLAVHPDMQKNGLGKALVNRTLWQVRALGGDRVYAETSGTEKYTSTHRFYEKTGFVEVARLADYYRPGDDKVIYCKQAS